MSSVLSDKIHTYNQVCSENNNSAQAATRKDKPFAPRTAHGVRAEPGPTQAGDSKRSQITFSTLVGLASVAGHTAMIIRKGAPPNQANIMV